MSVGLDHLGIEVDLDEGDLVASAVLIAKIVKPDGEVVLAISNSEGVSWIEQLGLLAAAHQASRSDAAFEPDDGDD